jgi:hypothetical protein
MILARCLVALDRLIRSLVYEIWRRTLVSMLPANFAWGERLFLLWKVPGQGELFFLFACFSLAV